jgi:Na+-driven multidrug efflux pump
LGYFMALIIGLGTVGVYVAFALSNIVGGIVSVLWVIMGNWAKPVIKNSAPSS